MNMNHEKTLENTLDYIKRVASTRGWILHNNADGTLDMLIDGLTRYFNNVGYYNCPCRDTFEDFKMDRDIVCPCDYAEPDISEFGRCYCALYFDAKFDFSKPIEMIPERRPDIDF